MNRLSKLQEQQIKELSQQLKPRQKVSVDELVFFTNEALKHHSQPDTSKASITAAHKHAINKIKEASAAVKALQLTIPLSIEEADIYLSSILDLDTTSFEGTTIDTLDAILSAVNEFEPEKHHHSSLVMELISIWQQCSNIKINQSDLNPFYEYLSIVIHNSPEHFARMRSLHNRVVKSSQLHLLTPTQ